MGDVTTLPPWPERPRNPVTGPQYHEHQSLLCEAYRARTEALLAAMSLIDVRCDRLYHTLAERHLLTETCPVRTRIEALVAACVRGANDD